MLFISTSKTNSQLKSEPNLAKIGKNIVITSALSCFSFLNLTVTSVLALPISLQTLPTALWGKPTCDVDPRDRALKDNLRNTNNSAYQALVAKHKDQLNACRSKDPIKTQALWLRLYVKDTKPEVLADVLDRIVNRGYNAVYVEVFYDGRILLPVSDNPTPWRSLTEEAVKAGKVAADYDLWAEIIRQGQQRGLRVHGVSSTMNFGYSYGQVQNRSSVLALNGRGETSISRSLFDPSSNLVANGQAFYLDPTEADHLFIDPYNLLAKSDFSVAIASLVKRQPDGILFDYLRYPSHKGLVNNVKDLWIYGEAARKSLLNSMPNEGSKQLMAMYLEQGKITPEVMQKIQKQNSGISQTQSKNPEFAAKVGEQLLWQLAVNHARQGVLNFVNEAIAIVNNSGNNLSNQNLDSKMTIGTVFSPTGNFQKSGAYDQRMQPWERFPLTLERHPMTYPICNDGKCVANEVMNVIKASKANKVCPVLAGTWGQSWRGHPSLEIQMQAIKAVAPQISCVSHFMYGWVEPDSEQERKAGL